MSVPEVAASMPESQDVQVSGDQSIGIRLIRASSLIAFGSISSRFIALLITVVSTRLLSEAEFGAYGVLQSTLNLFGITAGLSLGLGATRYIALYRVREKERARGIALVVLLIGTASSALTTLIMFTLSPWLAVHALHNPSLVTPLKWAAVQLFFFSVFGLASSILGGVERFGVTSVANIIQNVLILIGSVALIPVFRLSGAIWAQVLGIAVSLVLCLWCIRDIFRGFDTQSLLEHLRREWKPLLNFCLPSVLASFFVMPASWLSVMLIARGPNGFIELAYYTAADRFRLILVFVAGFVGTALLPILAGTIGSEDKKSEDSARALDLGLIGTALLVLPLSAALAFGGPEVMALFGRSYQANWAILLPIIAWAGAGAIGSTVGTALLAHGKQWFSFLQQATYGCSVLLLTFLLRSAGGAGLALAHLLAVLLLVAWSVPVLQRFHAITQRGTRILLVSTGMVCLLCLLAWACPTAWRLFLVGPVTLITTLFAYLFFPTGTERARLRSLVMARAGKTGKF
ncbi:MAG TPA: oligosaccharide flippase family protein [Pyrinomonadaceae bacterium]|nr:oligosaccharide flippase family protein [Pyrinomonadaceae bacterium]